eukprot:358307-Chlamydomonas_euryale.AAC.4
MADGSLAPPARSRNAQRPHAGTPPTTVWPACFFQPLDRSAVLALSTACFLLRRDVGMLHAAESFGKYSCLPGDQLAAARCHHYCHHILRALLPRTQRLRGRVGTVAQPGGGVQRPGQPHARSRRGGTVCPSADGPGTTMDNALPMLDIPPQACCEGYGSPLGGTLRVGPARACGTGYSIGSSGSAPPSSHMAQQHKSGSGAGLPASTPPASVNMGGSMFRNAVEDAAAGPDPNSSSGAFEGSGEGMLRTATRSATPSGAQSMRTIASLALHARASVRRSACSGPEAAELLPAVPCRDPGTGQHMGAKGPEPGCSTPNDAVPSTQRCQRP